ncbi:MAG: response regulator [Elusimicrobia bacterium]|nr:response regulator [Elusimicrobiota bacterium]
MKLLIVDDEKSMRELAARTLKEAGYDVETAESGDEALTRLPGDFEIVLTDLDMPGSLGGVELTKRVRSSSNKDVIIMTGFPDLTTAIEAVREGAYDYLVKPFSPDTLRMSVDRCAAKRSLSKDLERERALREELKRAYAELSAMQKVRDLFGQFTTQEVARFVMDHPDDFWKRGERREVTILFADVRQFTPYASRVPPEEAVRSLNQIFEVLVTAVREEGGEVNKFMGDGLMAIFGAPRDVPDHPVAATRAALKAQAMFQFLAPGGAGHDSLALGFALNTGEVIAGCVGAKDRTEYSVIGSAVNLAARIEKICRPHEIVIGPETAARVKSVFELDSRGLVDLPGFPDPVELFTVLGGKRV